MSNFLNFVRGGQTQIHHLTLSWQVIKKLVWLASCLLLITFAGYWLYKTPRYDYHLLMDYGIAEFCFDDNVICELALSKNRIKHILPDERAVWLTPRRILSDPAFHYAIQRAVDRAWWSLAVAIGVVIVFSVIQTMFWIRRGKKQKQKTLLRGAKLVTPKEFKRMVKKRGQASPWTLAGVPLPLEADTQHILLCGSPGGGKTVCTNELLAQVRQRKQKAIVFDIKGSFVPSYYRPGKDIILNPLDERCPSWNLWQECESLVDYDAMAAAIVPNTTNIDSFWLKAARTLLSITAAQLKKQDNPRMQDLLTQLFCSDLKTIEDLLKGTLGQALVGKDLEKGTRSIILTLGTYCKSLLYVKDELNVPPFLIREWVKNDDDSWLFINASQTMAETLKPIISLWVEIAVNSLLSLNEDRLRRLWLFFDELASLEKLNSLEPILSRGRGYGACFVGGIQDIHQLRGIYGDKATEVLISSFGTSLFFYQNNNRSAEWAAEQLGSAEFLEVREGSSIGAHEMRDGITLNQHIKEQRLVLGSEIRHLKKREAFMVTAGSWPVTKLEFCYKELEQKHPALIMRKLDDVTHQLVRNIDNQLETPSNLKRSTSKTIEEDEIALF